MSNEVIIKNAVKRYGDFTALHDVSLNIRQGEFFTLLGPSGCGKTTLLRMIAGFNSIEGGEFYFGDSLINDVPAHKRDIGMVFQNYAIFPHLTVEENVAYGLKARKTPKAEIDARVKEALELVQIAPLAGRKPSELSGGQQQRVALARAFVIEPSVLLMDEPLSNLDAKLRVKMRVEIRKLQQELGFTAIYVTHDQEEALAISDYIAVMSKGKVLQHGSPREIYFHPINAQVAHAVGTTNSLSEKQIQSMKAVFGHEVMNVRPESMHISKEASAEFVVPGVIEKVQFCGAHTEYQVRVEDGILKIIELNHWDGSNIKQCGEHVFVGCR